MCVCGGGGDCMRAWMPILFYIVASRRARRGGPSFAAGLTTGARRSLRSVSAPRSVATDRKMVDWFLSPCSLYRRDEGLLVSRCKCMLVRKAAHEVAGVELELCLRTVIVCVDDDGPKLLALESVLIAETHWHCVCGGGRSFLTGRWKRRAPCRYMMHKQAQATIHSTHPFSFATSLSGASSSLKGPQELMQFR